MTEHAVSDETLSAVETVEDIDTLRAERDHYRRERDELRRILDGILTSRSWRITGGLRSFMLMWRSLWPLWTTKSAALQLTAGRNMGRQGDSFVPTGPSPTMIARGFGTRIPTGWVKVSGTLLSSEGHIVFYLYPRLPGGYTDAVRMLLPFEAGAPMSQLVRLPPETDELRLDPFNAQLPFRFESLRVQQLGSLQFAAALVDRHLRGCWTSPGLFFRKLRRAAAVVREGGVVALRSRLSAEQGSGDYSEWVHRYDTLSEADRKAINDDIAAMEAKPTFSVVLPVYNTPQRWLRAAIDSVLGQLYPHWELVIADDASTEPHVRRILEEYRARDSRIKIIYRDTNGHIAACSQSAVEHATGDYIAFLDHDDELAPHALYTVAREAVESPGVGLFYSDEDKITEGGMRFNPYFKSGWNPELLRSQNYICHLTVIRRSLVDEVGGFRPGFDGAQDWDLVLRVTERLSVDTIRHIPHVLYHWRVIQGSTAQSTSYKPYVLSAQARAVKEHLQRRGLAGARVQIREDIAQLRVHYEVPPQPPSVNIIIPTRDRVDLLQRCVESILEKTEYPAYDITIVDNGSVQSRTLDFFAKITRDQRVRVLRDDGEFNFSRLNNRAAAGARGEFLALLNNDLEVITPGWLSEMVSIGVRPEVGIVGARLLFPNGLLQHGGVVLGIGGVAGHNHKGRPRHDPGYFNRAILPQNLSAVTAACLLIPREIYEAVGGLDERELSVAFNDVDLCLKVRSAGYEVIYNPYAEFYHFESASRGYETTPQKFKRFEAEIERMQRRWGDVLRNDPYYNPNLTLLREDFALSFPPRVQKPWEKRRAEIRRAA